MCSLSSSGLTLRILIHQEGGCWVARCVEFDILTAHKDRDEAWKDIQELCAAHILHAWTNKA